MKIALLAAAALAAFAAAPTLAADATPASLWTWTGPYEGVPPFDKADPKLFPAAFEEAIASRQAEVDAIIANPAKPNFENTIAAMERAGKKLERVNAVFDVMTANISNPEWQKLEAEWSPKLAAAYDRIAFDEKLFARVKAVHDNPAGLTTEQKRLTGIYYDRFVAAGVQLDAKGKAELGRINQRLAELFSQFNSKLLADEDTWTVVTDAKQLAGVPAGNLAAYKAAAESHGDKTGYYVVNTRSAVDPLLTFATDRALARAGVEEVRRPRRQWRQERHQRHHRRNRQAARRPRPSCSASRRMRIGGCRTRWPRTRTPPRR